MGMPPATSESSAGIDSGVLSEPDTPVGVATTASMDCLVQEYPSAPPKLTAEELLQRSMQYQSTKPVKCKLAVCVYSYVLYVFLPCMSYGFCLAWAEALLLLTDYTR